MQDAAIARPLDVVILGAGFAGICQARHLLLNLPGVRIALVDIPADERDAADMDLGESLSEVGALFVNKELGLHDYMIERHAPKQGQSFHWPKHYDATASLDDYFHVWANRESDVSNFHVNRSRFERDVLAMTLELGAIVATGHVVDVDLTPGDDVHTVRVLDAASGVWKLEAKHVVDASGRRFVIGKKTDNLLFGTEDLRGVDTGCARLRVRNVDRTVFHDGLDPDNTATSRYYSTHHWLGHGHWVWQVPSWNETAELSVGVVHHHEIIPTESLDTREKLLRFLEENHNHLYRLVASGETADFAYCPRVAHRSREMFSRDNWYVIGEAAYHFDPLYGHDTTATAIAVESVTEILRAKLRGETDAASQRARLDAFNLAFARGANALAARRARQLGHASAMSWRVFFESMWWFGLHVPMYVGKWHLDPGFIELYSTRASPAYEAGALFDDVYQTFEDAVEEGRNLGLMDVWRKDQLGSYTPSEHVGGFRFHVETEPGKCNVFRQWRRMALYVTWLYARLQWRARGLGGLLAPGRIQRLLGILWVAAAAGRRELSHQIRMAGKPRNSLVARNLEESRTYRRQPVLRPWGAELEPRTEASRPSVAHAPVAVSAKSPIETRAERVETL